MRMELNHQYNMIHEFKVQIGQATDKAFDSLILVCGVQPEEGSEWKGLTQTLKKLIYAKLDEIKGASDI